MSVLLLDGVTGVGLKTAVCATPRLRLQGCTHVQAGGCRGVRCLCLLAGSDFGLPCETVVDSCRNARSISVGARPRSHSEHD